MLKPGTSNIQSEKNPPHHLRRTWNCPGSIVIFCLCQYFCMNYWHTLKNIAIDAKFHQSKQKIVLRFISLLCIKWFNFIKANSILEPYMKYFAIDKFHQIYINCFLLNILIDKKWLKLRLETEKLKPKKSYRQ